MAKQSSTKDLAQQIQAQVDKVAAEQRKLDELQKKAATKLPPRPEVDVTETVLEQSDDHTAIDHLKALNNDLHKRLYVTLGKNYKTLTEKNKTETAISKKRAKTEKNATREEAARDKGIAEAQKQLSQSSESQRSY
ncbi:hypothetical protein E8E14_002115 [Neopestalotiopsis sp. 37M]|nr:hypothetical protein E8E14_002115 [Neopestalotiopsis sp. 37M]